MLDQVTTATRLLLIEDDAGVAEMYGAQLRSSGFSVDIAATGELGLHMALTHPPALIYLDLGLPEMTGLEVLQHLRAQPATATVPVVILTNFSEPELIEQARTLGARDFLIKAHTTPARLSAATQHWLKER